MLISGRALHGFKYLKPPAGGLAYDGWNYLSEFVIACSLLWESEGDIMLSLNSNLAPTVAFTNYWNAIQLVVTSWTAAIASSTWPTIMTHV